MKMDETALLRYLDEEAKQAHQYSVQIAAERDRAWRSYNRELYGNEEEGRSFVVASDVFDAIEGMAPDLLEVFTSSDKAVEFEPVGPEDEEGAKQATEACNYVFYKQNNGFLILYTAIKDALMLKTGGVKWWWDKSRVPTFTSYKGVDEMQLALFLTTNPDADVVEQEEVEAEDGMPRRFNVKIKTIKERNQVKLAPIPPEELQVSPHHNSVLLDECPYVSHISEKTLSEIRQMGYKVSVDDVKAAQRDIFGTDMDEERRWEGRDFDDNEQDESMVRGYLREEYVLVDMDGDGVAERRRVIRLGDKILSNEECSHVQIAAWTPYILTHRFEGISVADLVDDMQRIHTSILRGQLDNLALANNQETVVLTDSNGTPRANLDDLLNRRPGGIMREYVQGAVRPYAERWQGIEAMPMLEQLNVEKENRTGYTRYSQGLDADSLNKTARGVSMIMNASQKRMKLMARIVAECLMKPVFKGVFKTLTDFGMEPLAMRINGRFVQYDPQEWRDGYDMTVNVGIGTGDKVEQQQMLMTIAQAQAAVASSPFAGKLLTPKNVFNLQKRVAETAGFKSAEEFWTDPDTVQPQPPQPNPQVMVEQAKLQADQQKTQAQMQVDAQKSAQEMQWEREKFMLEQHFDAQQKELDRQHQLQLETVKARMNGAMNAAVANGRKPSIDDDGEVTEEPGPQEMLMLQVAQSLQMLAQAMNAPKQVIRDETGRAVGVAPVV